MSVCNPDFHYLDFDIVDFEATTNFGVFFKDYMFSLLPWYFKKNDTFKDNDNKGLLERYLSIFGQEIDEEIIPKIECYMNIIVAQECESRFLIHLSDVLGNPPDVFNNETQYRNLLAYIVSIYKIKGTKAAYELFFGLLGFTIELVELSVTNAESQYNNDGSYDTGDSDSIYDQTKCSPCSDYDITFFPKDLTNLVLSSDTLDALNDAIDFNEPINATLNNLTFAIMVEDIMGVNIVDVETDQVDSLLLYDIGGEEYDNVATDDYDDIPLIGEGAVQTNITFTLVDLGSDNYRLDFIMVDNFDPVTVVQGSTSFIIKNFDVNGDLISQIPGPILNFDDAGANIAGIIAAFSFNEPDLISMQITGNIELSDAKIATLDHNLNISGETLIPIYFI